MLQVHDSSSNFKHFPQEMEICFSNGRDCIEKNFGGTFNCSTSCTGIYADVQWVGSDIEEEIKDDRDKLEDLKVKSSDDMMQIYDPLKRGLEREMELMKKDFGGIVKSTFGKGLAEEDKKKYRSLISEYRKFKIKNVKHFRFNSAVNLSAFGES